MDQRRYLSIVIMTMLFFMIWARVAPQLFPGIFPKPQPKPAVEQADQVDEEVFLNGEKVEDETIAAADPKETPETVEKPELKVFENQQVQLGEAGFDSGYLLQAQLNTKGAAVDWVQLTDPRYKTLDRKEQLKVVGNPVFLDDGGRTPATFEMAIPQLDSQLTDYETSLAEVDWEITKQDAESVTFRYPSPNGELEVLKTYRIEKADLEGRDDSPQGYLLDMQIVLRNTSTNTVETSYTLQGPVGVPLENVENTRSFREIDIATISDPSDPQDTTSIHLTAAELVKQQDKAEKGGNPVTSWRDPIYYAGLDVQFFTALLLPERIENTEGKQYFDVVQPQLLSRDKKTERSDFSILMTSTPQKIKANGEVTHNFKAFFGPKRKQLLEPINAGDVVRLGWFSVVAKAMLFVLDFFHNNIGLPYAFAIILLTVVVRGMMFPISKKQAIESEKMKVLAPKLKEIQDKHKDKPEEFAKAYRAFQKKYNYHPMVGCLPALLQLPIFYGLYTSLYQAVDLRLAQFLWIDNLAAPDALFEFGFTIPWFQFTTFNLLPILTVILFVVQQKMFTPPPTSEEQAMTYKMMNYMMIFIGVMFYRVPAGLCLYFISSSLWGICERSILKSNVKSDGTIVEAEDVPPTAAKTKETAASETPKQPGFLERLREAADQAHNAANNPRNDRKYSKQSKNKKR